MDAALAAAKAAVLRATSQSVGHIDLERGVSATLIATAAAAAPGDDHPDALVSLIPAAGLYNAIPASSAACPPPDSDSGVNAHLSPEPSSEATQTAASVPDFTQDKLQPPPPPPTSQLAVSANEADDVQASSKQHLKRPRPDDCSRTGTSSPGHPCCAAPTANPCI